MSNFITKIENTEEKKVLKIIFNTNIVYEIYVTENSDLTYEIYMLRNLVDKIKGNEKCTYSGKVLFADILYEPRTVFTSGHIIFYLFLDSPVRSVNIKVLNYDKLLENLEDMIDNLIKLSA